MLKIDLEINDLEVKIERANSDLRTIDTILETLKKLVTADSPEEFKQELLNLSAQIKNLSVRKNSIRDQQKEVPWNYLIYLQIFLKKYSDKVSLITSNIKLIQEKDIKSLIDKFEEFKKKLFEQKQEYEKKRPELIASREYYEDKIQIQLQKISNIKEIYNELVGFFDSTVKQVKNLIVLTPQNEKFNKKCEDLKSHLNNFKELFEKLEKLKFDDFAELTYLIIFQDNQFKQVQLLHDDINKLLQINDLLRVNEEEKEAPEIQNLNKILTKLDDVRKQFQKLISLYEALQTGLNLKAQSIQEAKLTEEADNTELKTMKDKILGIYNTLIKAQELSQKLSDLLIIKGLELEIFL